MISCLVFQYSDKQLAQLDYNDYCEAEDEDYQEVKLCDALLQERIFNQIDNFGEYKDYDGLEYTSFWSGGQEWISPMSVKEFTDSYSAYKLSEEQRLLNKIKDFFAE
jgi:hypothetical protein